MADANGAFVGQAQNADKSSEILLYGRANRHGVVAGATGKLNGMVHHEDSKEAVSA